MTREIIAVLMLSLVPIFGFLAFSAVRRKRGAQELLIQKPDTGEIVDGIDCLYVATVFEDAPLERVWAHGLGPRGEAKIATSEGEVVIERLGESGLKLHPTKVSLSRATIDKGLEADGLVSLHWRSLDTNLITQIRFRSTQSQAKFLDSMKNIDRVK